MTVSFYKFAKRVNSTLRPSSGNTDHDCKLKANCSEHDPVLILSSNEFGYTYAYIADWGKYYFVTDVISLANGLVEYHLKEDVLATYKTDIGDTKAQIAFCSNKYNVNIIDPRLQVENRRTLNYKFIAGQSAFPKGLSTGGYYLLSVFNPDDSVSSSGMSVTYMISPAGMKKVRKWFGSNMDAIAQYFHGTPLSAVMSCLWVPYEIPGDDDNTYRVVATRIQVGDRVSNVGTDPVTFNTGELYIVQGFPVFTKEVDIPIHLRHSSSGYVGVDFRDQEPYTTGMLYLPGAGFVQIAMGDWFDSDNIYCECVIEGLTGNLRYNLWHDKVYSGTPPIAALDNLIQTVDCCVAATCSLGQITTNATGTINSIGTMVGGAIGLAGSIAASVATEGAALPLVAASAGTLIAGAANTALAANQHAATVTGTNGSRMTSIFNRYRYFETVINVQDPDDTAYIDLKGRPCATLAFIKNMFVSPDPTTGFVQCESASVESKASFTEMQEINTYLNAGFYWE